MNRDRCRPALLLLASWCLWIGAAGNFALQADHLRELQAQVMERGVADWGRWGLDPAKYRGWGSHSNRLIPVYTYGMSLDTVRGPNSVYRSAEGVKSLYGVIPENTVNPQSDYFDQTDIYRLQKTAAAAGKKYIILVVFDGMDWQTTQAAAIYRSGKVAYREGRGTGLHFQDYRGAKTDYGYMVTAPYCDEPKVSVDFQMVLTPGGKLGGGYDWKLAGSTPWEAGEDPTYIISRSSSTRHAYADSAATATAMTTGRKTYNDAVNVDQFGRPVPTIAHQLQQQGKAIGVVTNVPISHATPACAYAHNVNRSDYQDLTRDLLGLPSIAHRNAPLPGVDLLIGAGWGETKAEDSEQGMNFVPGNRYLADDDLRRIDAANGGRYQVALRTPGVAGPQVLADAVKDGVANQRRLFGYFGAMAGHLPYRTADGNYNPTAGNKPAEEYTPADLHENPTLAQMTQAALSYLEHSPNGFWLMVEVGDVDWANHDNNIDNSVGATISGDDAFRAITDWVEAKDAWNETAVILTADHGHYLVLDQPEALIPPAESQNAGN